MALIAQLASFLGVEINETVSASKRALLLYSVLAALVAIAAAFLLIAAYLGLSAWLGPVVAALIIAAVALVTAAALFAIVQAKVVADRREAAQRRQAQTTALAAMATAEALPSLLKSPLIRNVGLPIGAALAAFYLAHRLDSSDD